MVQTKPIPVRDRDTGKIVGEWMDDNPQTYEMRPQWSPTQWIKSTSLYDKYYAVLQYTARSAHRIEPFIKKYHINMDDFEYAHYRSFGEFFIRRLRPGARKFPLKPDEMGAFAEARYLAWEKFDGDQLFPVKGKSLDAAGIMGSAELAQPFVGGPAIMARLAPVDYHHMHYPDNGKTLEQHWLGSRIWTVTWRALQSKPDIILKNERQINILQTENFGRLAFIEVGALTVGRIVQVHPIDKPFERGETKSAFRFGGSAIVVFGEPGAWRPSDDLLEYTPKGIETMVRLGEPIAQSLRTPDEHAESAKRLDAAQPDLQKFGDQAEQVSANEAGRFRKSTTVCSVMLACGIGVAAGCWFLLRGGLREKHRATG